MNEEDLRDCFAMFAMMGLVMREGVMNDSKLEVDAYVMADLMMTQRSKPLEKDEAGIAAVKRTRKTK